MHDIFGIEAVFLLGLFIRHIDIAADADVELPSPSPAQVLKFEDALFMMAASLDPAVIDAQDAQTQQYLRKLFAHFAVSVTQFRDVPVVCVPAQSSSAFRMRALLSLLHSQRFDPGQFPEPQAQ